MQNRYTGDIGDFGKLGLLRAGRASGLTVGVNWYLVNDETHNGDGYHVRYLEDDRCRHLDEPLWLELRQIVRSGKREVSALENDRILKAVFYSDPLLFDKKTKAERAAARMAWHEKALAALAGTDVVFVDPDNGIVTKTALGTPKENKYVKPEELADYIGQGSSVIYYQHKARRTDPFYLDQQERMLSLTGPGKVSGLSLKFTRTSQRYYFFLIQPFHREAVTSAVDGFLSRWNSCFRVIG